MTVYNQDTPYPMPTSYPMQGANPYVPVGALGAPISSNSRPMSSGGAFSLLSTTGDIQQYPQGAQVPANTPTPVPQPVPTPQRQSSGPNPGYGSSFPGQTVTVNGVTYHSNADGSWSVVSGGGQDPSAIDLQSIYQPAMQTLQSLEDQYRSQFPMYQQQVEASTAAGLKDVSNQQSTAEANLANQQTSVDTAQTSALSQARQLYNELAQRYGAMFGSRTSAGPFAMEILGRETQKQFGNIGQTATQGTQAVKQAATQLGNWVNTQTQEWNRKKTDALNNLQISFNNAIQQINASRNQLESDKAGKRYQALVDAQSQAAQIQQADKTFTQQLALFQAQNQTPASYSQGNVVGQQVGQLSTPWGPAAANMVTNATGTSTQNGLPTGKYTWEFDPTTGQYRQVPAGTVSNTG